MAKEKIIGMPLRVEPDENFELVCLVVKTEIDGNAYDPGVVKPDEINYYIYDRDGTLITSGSFDTECNDGLFITRDSITISELGVYAVYYYSATIKAIGFSQIHVSLTDYKIKDRLDVGISTRAPQITVNAIKAQTDKLQFDANNYIKANVQDKGVLNDPSVSDIDSQLSSSHGSGSWEGADVSNLALESTAQAIKAQTDKMQFDGSNNILSMAQNSELSNLDATISSRASQTTADGIKSQTDKLQFDANNYVKVNVQDKGVLNDPSVSDIDSQLSSSHGSGSWETADTSSLALESTAQAIKAQTDKLTFDASNNIEARVNDKGVLNDPSVTDIDNQLSSTHGSGSWEGGSGGSCDPAAIADAVWDEATADHVSAGTFGLLMSNIYAKILTIYDKIKKLW